LCFPDVTFLSNEVLEKINKAPNKFYFSKLGTIASK
jgi:hypothetical protein